jgi:hypothetical protein
VAGGLYASDIGGPALHAAIASVYDPGTGQQD